jgi:hypothetical protein
MASLSPTPGESDGHFHASYRNCGGETRSSFFLKKLDIIYKISIVLRIVSWVLLSTLVRKFGYVFHAAIFSEESVLVARRESHENNDSAT